MTSPEFAVSAAPPGRIILSYHSNKIYKLHNKRHLSTVRFLQSVRRVMSIATNVNSALGFH